jgi:hypothetical protein
LRRDGIAQNQKDRIARQVKTGAGTAKLIFVICEIRIGGARKSFRL